LKRRSWFKASVSRFLNSINDKAMNLEYKTTPEGKVIISLNGEEIGSITGGEKGLGGKAFWDVATGQKTAPEPEYSYWLKDYSTSDYINSKGLTTINQAKALAEHHFLSQKA
jgi:hypothetical protein